jgi:hypothetical protein
MPSGVSSSTLFATRSTRTRGESAASAFRLPSVFRLRPAKGCPLPLAPRERKFVGAK